MEMTGQPGLSAAGLGPVHEGMCIENVCGRLSEIYRAIGDQNMFLPNVSKEENRHANR